MTFQMPTGLINAAAGIGTQAQGIPTGLTQNGLFQSLGQTDPAAQIRQTVMADLSEINEFKYGSDWQNPNSNAVENFLNDSEGPAPWFKVEGSLSLGENGLQTNPVSGQYGQLYDYEEADPYYSVFNYDTKEYDRITNEEAQAMSGYTEGQSFRAEDGGQGARYHENASGWNPSDGSGYVKNEDPYSRYVDNWVTGEVPDPEHKNTGLNMDREPTQVFGSVYNPIMQTYIDQINSRLTPEQIQTALAAGYDPLEISYKINDWDLKSNLFGSDASGLGKQPLALMDQLDTWTNGLFEAAGAGGSGMNQYQLPTGLTGYRRA